MCMETQDIFRYLSENMLKGRDETPPLGASLPSKALKKKIPAPEPERSSSGSKGGRIGPRRGVSTEGISRPNAVVLKGPGNDSCFASSCWGEVQVSSRTLK